MRIVGQALIAEQFKVTPQTIVAWQQEGFPIAVRGGDNTPSEYDLPECIEWYRDREVRKVQVITPRDKLFTLQAQEIEMRLAEARGQLVRADSIEPRLRAAVIAAREFLLRASSRLAGELEGCDRRKREQVLRDAFEAFLRKLSNWRQVEEELEDDAP